MLTFEATNQTVRLWAETGASKQAPVPKQIRPNEPQRRTQMLTTFAVSQSIRSNFPDNCQLRHLRDRSVHTFRDVNKYITIYFLNLLPSTLSCTEIQQLGT